MNQPMIFIDFRQMLNRDIVACSSLVSELHLQIHPGPQNHLPYR